MALLLIGDGMNHEGYAAELRRQKPDIDLRYWPESKGDPEVRYALAWHPPAGALASYPKLEAIFCTGAGVEHILRDPQLPDVPLARFVDPNLTMRMTEYVCLNVLLHLRRVVDYMAQQREKQWKELPQPGADEVRVGVMGMGVLGQDAAEKLVALGFQVAGWSRTPKEVPGVTCYAGAEQLTAFLNRTDILVCLLPLTRDTEGILSGALFRQLATDGVMPGPVLINAGRGKLQVEADIVEAMTTGHLFACSLDVFETEPLPKDSPLWRYPRIVITPHMASISDLRAVCRSVLAQIDQVESGGELENVVDVKRGY